MKKTINILMIIMMIMVLSACGNYKLFSKNVNVEYGTPISKVVTDYIDVSKMHKEEIKVLKEESNVSLNAENEEGKDYPAIGNYTLQISYGDENFNINIHVVDTVIPEFNECETIKTFTFEKLEYASYVLATDLSEIEITFNDDNILFDKVGEYKLIAKAVDTSGNTNTKEIIVIVKSDEEYQSVYNQVLVYSSDPQSQYERAQEQERYKYDKEQCHQSVIDESNEGSWEDGWDNMRY